MNYRQFAPGLLVWLMLTGVVACQSRTKPAEQSATIQTDTTVFDDDTLEGAIKESVPLTNKKN